MNLSGILVVTKPEWQAQVVESLNALEGLEVHQVDSATGRIIAVQEAGDVYAEVEGLKRIKALPHVIMAEMVYHYIAEDEKTYADVPAELDEHQAGFVDGAVPSYLNS